MFRKFFVLFGFCILTTTFLFIWNILTPEKAKALIPGAPDENKEKTVEQVKKNIQVLTGLPASQLNMVMDCMATSLGVRCQHCHVQDSSGWQFDKDDRPEKRTARKMIQMVMELNATKFGGRNAVTCYTCHHGTTDPAAMIPLPQNPPRAGKEEHETETPLPAIEQLLSGYETALGGADALKKITSRVSKGIAVDLQGRESPLEVVQEHPDKYATSVTMREGMLFTRAFNGTNGWMSSPRGTHELSPGESEDLKREAALFPITRMQELASKLHASRKDTVNGATVYCLSAPIDEHSTENYFLDSATGLLLRKVIITETLIGNIPDQTDFSDYRVVDGVKVPFTVRIAGVDPRDGSTHRFTSIEQNVSIDEKKFEMPAGKK
jgi:photosynthetic reaction center cytochrome c subunit